MKLYLQLLLLIFFISNPFISISQIKLEANGPGNTYELINSVLAPGYDVIENPECVHPEFGRHIAEVWDSELNQYVFEFYSHVTPDNDRCINFDRERVEIKTYESSPDNLKGTLEETITYKWKFRLAVGFQPSSNFTHIHQIKAVGGTADDPIFTLTPRKGNPNKLELIHNNTTKLIIVNLSLFDGTWVEATEIIKVGAAGTYSINIKKVSDGTSVLSYSSNNIMTIRPDNNFIRPKWGIYRSLLSPTSLRDESIRFAGFSIAEGAISTDIKNIQKSENNFFIYPNPVSKTLNVAYSLIKDSTVKLIISNIKGQVIKILIDNEFIKSGDYNKCYDISDLPSGNYIAQYISGNFSKSFKLIVKK